MQFGEWFRGCASFIESAELTEHTVLGPTNVGAILELINVPESPERSGVFGTFRSDVPECPERSRVAFRIVRNVPESGFYY